MGSSTGDGADTGSGSSVSSDVGISSRPVSGTAGEGGLPEGGASRESGFTESRDSHGDSGAGATVAVGGAGDVVADSRVGSGMRLPPLPEFRADNSSDHEGEAYERWLRKLTKRTELQR